MIPSSNDARPIVFGEILYDHFPDGRQRPGGAPFNVCWHLRGFGYSPLLISATGDDQAGQRLRHSMREWGLDLGGLQTNPRATGAVHVSQRDGEPVFDIAPESAWDAIDADQARAALGDTAVMLLYHGTLALRSHTSRNALETLRDGLGLPTLVDINLRPPWWQSETLSESLTQATWAKLNHHELRSACDCEGLPSADLVTMAQTLRARHGLDLLLITEGAGGAMLVSSDEIAHEAAPVITVTDAGDSVGAGDAFSAIIVIGLLQDWPPQLTLRRAVRFASRIIAQDGATAHDPELYQQQQQDWKREQ